MSDTSMLECHEILCIYHDMQAGCILPDVDLDEDGLCIQYNDKLSNLKPDHNN